jgi:hypothetical protein
MKVVLLVSELEIRFILQASFYDLNDQLTYSIVANSMNVTDSSLQNWVDRNPFKIAGDQLQLNFNVEDAALRGMFIFKVLVTNLGQFLE